MLFVLDFSLLPSCTSVIISSETLQQRLCPLTQRKSALGGLNNLQGHLSTAEEEQAPECQPRKIEESQLGCFQSDFNVVRGEKGAGHINASESDVHAQADTDDGGERRHGWI